MEQQELDACAEQKEEIDRVMGRFHFAGSSPYIAKIKEYLLQKINAQLELKGTTDAPSKEVTDGSKGTGSGME